MGFEINELMMPADALGEYVITVTTNPTNIIGGPVMIEQSFGNNDGNLPLALVQIQTNPMKMGLPGLNLWKTAFLEKVETSGA